MRKPEIVFDADAHKYTVDGVPVPSVTQILGVLDKPALPWWGMTVGVQGVAQLRNLGAEIPWADADGITKMLTEHKLTVNHVRDKGGARGSGAHGALEQWMQFGTPPQPLAFPVEERGYMQALARALIALRPEVIATEVMVASVEHGFAGRYDLVARIRSKDSELMERLGLELGATALLDLKTSKGIYPDQHFPQVEAYEGASVECGGDPTDARLVLRLGADGMFEVARSYATFEDFLAIKGAFDALRRLKAAKPRKARAKAAA